MASARISYSLVRNGSINNPERHLPDEPVAFGMKTPLQDSAGMITPASLHFIVSHGFEPPDINPQEHRLMIHGMVDRPLVFTVDELKRLPAGVMISLCPSATETAAPQDGGRRHASRARCHGAGHARVHQLQPVDRRAAVPAAQRSGRPGVGATWIIAEGADPNKHSKSIPLGKAMEDALVAYAQNGEPVRPEQGFPAAPRGSRLARNQ